MKKSTPTFFFFPFTRWHYVITGILEVNVKPSLHMWSWKHIKRHRQQVKQYKELYKTKITNKKPAETLLKKLEVNSSDLEKSCLTVAVR